MSSSGFVILERPAGEQLMIVYGAVLWHTREDAEKDKRSYEKEAKAHGRKVRYMVATLQIPEDDRD